VESIVSTHKSTKGFFTFLFNDGDIAFTAFAEDISNEANIELKRHLDPTLRTKKRADGTVSRFYATRGKVLVGYRSKGARICENGYMRGLAYIESISEVTGSPDSCGNHSSVN
jgi:hypothetical protein